MELDLTDPDVRDMANRNHTPVEQWATAGVLLSVYCDECGNNWPCPTRLALRELAKPAPGTPTHSSPGGVWREGVGFVDRPQSLGPR